MADVFISYSRHDSAFVHELHDALTTAGRDVWVDWEDIPPASRWEQDIDESIDAAESIVFVLSSSSLESEYCGLELTHAEKRGKRIVPLAIDGASPDAAPAGLRQLNWIWCRDTDDRERALDALGRALDTDLDWAKGHTRLLVRAVEWDKRKDRSLLLRGKDLREVEHILAANAGKDPKPTEVQQRYVHVSRKAAARRQRTLLGSVLVALGVSITLALFAVLQRNTARTQRDHSASVALAAAADGQVADHLDYALVLAAAAYRASPTAQARSSVLSALDSARSSGTVGVFRVDSTGVDDVAVSPDGQTIAAAVAANGKVRFFDADTHAERGPALSVPPDPTYGRGFVAYSPDGHTLATAGRRDGVQLWDLRAGRWIKSGVPLHEHDRTVDGVAFLNANTLVTSNGVIWDIRKPEHIVGRLAGGGAGVAFSAVSQRLVLVRPATNGTLASWMQVWNMETRAKVGPPKLTDYAYGIAFDAQGRTLATGHEDGTVHFWKPGTWASAGKPLRGHTHQVRGLAFDGDGRVVTGSLDGTVRIWDMGARAGFGAVLPGSAGPMAFSPDGRTLATASAHGRGPIRLWDADSRKPLASLPGTSSERIGALVFSHDGKTLAAAGEGVRLWDVEARRLIEKPALADMGRVDRVAFGTDGRTLTTLTRGVMDAAYGACRQATVRLWDLTADTEVGTPARTPVDECVVLSQDGSVLAALGDAAGEIELWDVRKGAAVGRRLVGSNFLGFPYDGPVMDAAFSPDGRTLVAGIGEGTVRLWDVRTHEELGRPVLRTSPRGEWPTVRNVAFAADGRTLAVVDDGGVAQLWDVGTRLKVGTPIAVPFGEFDTTVALSADGRTLALTAPDGVHLWESLLPADANAVTAEVCRRAGNLSKTEWREASPDLPYRTFCSG